MDNGNNEQKEIIASDEEKQLLLPPLADVQSYVRSWEDPELDKQYQETVGKLYQQVEQETPAGKISLWIRTGLLDIPHPVGETGQVIHNIGTAHDKNPQSQMNMMLRKRVQDYIAETPEEKRFFLLEGWNVPEGQQLSEKFTKRIDSCKQQEGETEDEAYQRAVQLVGEQGNGLFYALRAGANVDYHTDIALEKEVAAFKSAGISDGEIATFLLPRFLDLYKQGNEFTPDTQFTQEQLFESLSQVMTVTGWKKELLDSFSVDQRGIFVAEMISEVNAIMQSEIGKKLLSDDYRPQYRFANELANDREKSQVATKMFNISGDVRDRHIAARAYKAVQEGKSPFLIFGDSHTYKIDPALSYLSSQTKAV